MASPHMPATTVPTAIFTATLLISITLGRTAPPVAIALRV
eukprot:CAMPEP_0119476916 /NCGR_PEP_ID=MMETSP1344-20130328/7255_1 /TAXON_ID=236787 /ORGANISM="Florenciella parvula, Strain CCMP2471" /LENGTH=39 /DNA_ID= /DNA_START= /DNA_END= /DNA_ORIENTATION=